MPGLTAAELERTWSWLYVAIISAQYQVELQRGTEDVSPISSFNIPLTSHPEIAEGLSIFYSNFVDDYKENRADSAIFEFFIKFGILEETVQLAVRDIPQGILGHVVALFGAVVAHLPSDAFLHEKLSGAIKKLCKHLPAAVNSIDRASLLLFMEATIIKLVQERKLSLIFADVRRPLLSMLRSLLRTAGWEERDGFLASDLSGLLLDALLVLSSDYNSELETLFLELIFHMVDLLCEGSPAAFCAMLNYLGKCLEALKRCGDGKDEHGESAESALAFIDLYRSCFVDRIFSNMLLSATKSRDHSMTELLRKISNLLEGSDCNDLIVIMVSKMTRTFEKENLEALSIDKWPLMRLYSHILGNSRLQSCLAICNPFPWKEASMVHRNRLERIFSLVQKTIPRFLSDHSDAPAILSSLYKCHLGVIESILSPGYTLENDASLVSRPSGQYVPRLREAFPVLDQDKNRVLWSLYDSAKSELSNFWDFSSLTRWLTLCHLVTQVLCFSNVPVLYAEYVCEHDKDNTLLHQLSVLLEKVPGAEEDILIDPLLIKHQYVDAFEPVTWEILSKDLSQTSLTAPGTYLLMHVLLRMAAIIQARAIRPPVKIYYE